MAIVDGTLYITGTSGDNWEGPNGEKGVNEHSRGITYGDGGKTWHEYSRDIFLLALNKYNGSYKWHTFHGESNWNEEVYGIAVVKMNNEGANGWHTFRGRDILPKDILYSPQISCLLLYHP